MSPRIMPVRTRPCRVLPIKLRASPRAGWPAFALHLQFRDWHAADQGNAVTRRLPCGDEAVLFIELPSMIVVIYHIEVYIMAVAMPGKASLKKQVPDSPAVEGGQNIQCPDKVPAIVGDLRRHVTDNLTPEDSHEVHGARRASLGGHLDSAPNPGTSLSYLFACLTVHVMTEDLGGNAKFLVRIGRQPRLRINSTNSF